MTIQNPLRISLHTVPGQSAVLNEDRTVLAMRSCKTESQLLIVPQRHIWAIRGVPDVEYFGALAEP